VSGAPGSARDWSIHAHEGGGTQIVNEGLNQLSVDYEFTPATQATWHLLIRNGGPTSMNVQVRIELYGAISWQGWQ
jgi:hypothetical protein